MFESFFEKLFGSRRAPAVRVFAWKGTLVVLLTAVEQVLAEFRAFSSTRGSGAVLLTGAIGEKLLDDLWKEVRNWSEADVARYEALIRVRELKLSPYAYVMNHLASAAGRALTSGHYVHRGVPCMVGEAWLSILNFAADAMVREGVMTQECADKEVRGPILRAIADTA